MRIPVVFATDENYLFFTCVAITSMAQSAKKDTFYQIYILAASDFSDQTGLLDRVQKTYDRIRIEIIFVDDNMFQSVTIHNTHVTKATFYRLILNDLIEEDKCLYLDGDIIVTEDLETLYKTDLGENYLAGCRDIWIDLLSEEEREIRRERTGIFSMDQYVNAGVLLFNLKQLRADKMGIVFLKQLHQDYLFEDQDILNVCCYGRILHLPAKWNLFTLFMGQLGQMQKAGIEEDTLYAFREKKGIIHYATPMIRPWKRENCWMNIEWWKIAEEWAGETAYQNIEKEVREYGKRNCWDYYENLCSRYERVVIFGYTKYSEQLCDWVVKIKEKQSLIFCDNDKNKQGQDYGGIPVVSFKEALRWCEQKRAGKALFLIASQRRQNEIQEFLTAKGVVEDEIAFYRAKNKNYYLFLDERYYRDELQDICKRECRDWNEFCLLSMDEIRTKLAGDKVYDAWMERYYLDSWLLKEQKDG